MNAEQSIYVPKDVWREILRNLCDYRSCLAVHLTSKSFRKIINDRFKIAEHYKGQRTKIRNTYFIILLITTPIDYFPERN